MDLLSQLKRDEGLRLKPYVDTVGRVTIGYGTNLSDGIDGGEAEYLLSNRLNRTKLELVKALPWICDMDEVRRAVLYNMAYNLGVHGLLQFKTTLGLVQKGHYQEAAQEMLKSHWAEQVGDRAHRLSLQMQMGEWI